VDLDTELEAWVRLSLTHGFSDEHFRRLLVALGGPQQILAASAADLARVVPRHVAAAVHGPVAEETMRAIGIWLDDSSNHIVTLADPSYPQALLQIADPPPLIYAKGRVTLLNHDSFAVVGSRNATQQGLAHAESFARVLSDAGLTIVSGLALGIDAAAHRGGLTGASSTIGVVGTGLDIVYPARNRELAHQLAQDGCIISEFTLGTPPVAANFPRRNRLISGLARGCLVVEAAISSGSLITARMANEQGKDVFAIPGSIHSPLAKGCHNLIKQGAKLAETADDILEELRLPAVGTRLASVGDLHTTTDHVFDALGFEPCDIDTLSTRTGMGTEKIAALLTEWEIEGRVEALPGGRYQRVR
jgi:DNA processing protein